MVDADDASIPAISRTRVLARRERADTVAVLFHGFTSSPAQLAAVADALFAFGWAVVVPRLPFHGESDRLFTGVAGLTMGHLERCAVDVLERARPLGNRVVVGGFSLGGLVALHAAFEHRVDRAVVIAPLLGLALLPSPLDVAVARAATHLPNRFLWWDPRQRELLGPAHGYPQFPTRVVARSVLYARHFVAEVRRRPPATADLTLVLNDGEMTVSNAAARRLARGWSAHPGTRVRTERLRGFPPSHDVVEPERDPILAARALPTIVAAFLRESEAPA